MSNNASYNCNLWFEIIDMIHIPVVGRIAMFDF